ncbi:MAG: hypothetical protein D8M57_01315 [Candidatus Scalindua sp. AMX11]|nr:MAG: hypothetical protein DWQ00_15295 [Candidatus Scalindua sp.]NOG85028.1 hypothetical protein [Planctomycetota bacterium]RZV93079.1 MAG: hypothetical protein EX341_04230 [Candidatus Scalindua sp. SCAELEC01]TDE66705.1 MAG: hypothetical protein D8M57_01315 [Candidatus Scalindua sp. AMX11]
MKSWFYLAGTIILEIAGIASVKLSESFTKVFPSILVFVFYALSFICSIFIYWVNFSRSKYVRCKNKNERIFRVCQNSVCCDVYE